MRLLPSVLGLRRAVVLAPTPSSCSLPGSSPPQAYSYENDAQKNIFHTRDNSTFVAFDDFRERRTYLLVGTTPANAKCQTRPAQGELFVPPVASFRFRAVEKCTWCPTPIEIQTWEGRTQQQGASQVVTTTRGMHAPQWADDELTLPCHPPAT